MNYINTINRLIESIRASGTQQVYYSRFGVERGNVKYPALILIVDNITRNQQGINQVNLSLTYIENYTSSDQIVDIQSRGINSIVNSINYIYNNSTDLVIGGSQNQVFTPFLDQFSDQCAGVVSALQIVYSDNIGECSTNPCNN